MLHPHRNNGLTRTDPSTGNHSVDNRSPVRCLEAVRRLGILVLAAIVLMGLSLDGLSQTVGTAEKGTAEKVTAEKSGAEKPNASDKDTAKQEPGKQEPVGKSPAKKETTTKAPAKKETAKQAKPAKPVEKPPKKPVKEPPPTQLSVLVFDGLADPDAPTAANPTAPLHQILAKHESFQVHDGDLWQPKKETDQLDFKTHDVVILAGDPLDWDAATRSGLLEFVAKGGGMVAMHQANQLMPDWPAYHRMLGLGRWHTDDTHYQSRISWDQTQSKIVRVRVTPSDHPEEQSSHTDATAVEGPILLDRRSDDHPITAGLPEQFWQTDDVLLSDLSGPAENLHVLATALSDSGRGGSGRHEPVLMTTSFGKGRVFHTVLGHDAAAMAGAAFQVTMVRGIQWAATGQVWLAEPSPAILSAGQAVTVALVAETHQQENPTTTMAVTDPQADQGSPAETSEGEAEQETNTNEAKESSPSEPQDTQPVVAPDLDAGDWTALFDGETLEGWTQKNGTGTFRVEDGIIIGKTAKGSPNSFLCTTKDYADFELTFEIHVDRPLNTGVQIRSLSKPEFKDGRVHGPQVEIESSPGNAGYFYSEATGRAWITKDHPPQDAFQNDQWNRFTVRAKGDRLQSWINGDLIADVMDKQSSHKGFIGLQVHSIKNDEGPYEVRWRDIRIRELPTE